MSGGAEISMGAKVSAGFCLALGLSALPAAAQEPDCTKPVTQLDLAVCAQRDFEAAEAELTALMAELAPAAKAGGYAGRLAESRRVWAALAVAYCDAQAAGLGLTGNARSEVTWRCRAKKTRGQIAAVKAFFE